MATKGLLESKNSVLQNIGISALKGAAINLGVQAVGRNLKKDNLLSTLAVGAVAGIADSFIESKISNSNGIASGAMTGLLLGGGNAIINKSSIGGTALKYAVITAVVEGVFNIARANAINFADDANWTVVEDYHLPKGDLKPHSQKGNDAGCAQATLDSIAEYLGIKLTTSKYYVGSDFSLLAKENGLIAEDLIKQQVGTKHINISWSVGNYLRMGYPAALTYNDSGIQHIVGINRIIKEHFEKVKKDGSKIEKDRWRVQIMNPIDNGLLEYIPASILEYGLVTIVKP